MKKWLSTAFVVWLSSFPAFASEPMNATDVAGTWEGDSKCTVRNSPCHDEHVIYHIAADKAVPDKARLEAYKVEEGKQELMGTLDCLYRAGEILTCTSNTSTKDYWEFRIIRDRMIGSLVVGEQRTLYRRMGLRRK
jgi:hypothetical protein